MSDRQPDTDAGAALPNELWVLDFDSDQLVCGAACASWRCTTSVYGAAW